MRDDVRFRRKERDSDDSRRVTIARLLEALGYGSHVGLELDEIKYLHLRLAMKAPVDVGSSFRIESPSDAQTANVCQRRLQVQQRTKNLPDRNK